MLAWSDLEERSLQQLRHKYMEINFYTTFNVFELVPQRPHICFSVNPPSLHLYSVSIIV